MINAKRVSDWFSLVLYRKTYVHGPGARPGVALHVRHHGGLGGINIGLRTALDCLLRHAVEERKLAFVFAKCGCGHVFPVGEVRKHKLVVAVLENERPGALVRRALLTKGGKVGAEHHQTDNVEGVVTSPLLEVERLTRSREGFQRIDKLSRLGLYQGSKAHQIFEAKSRGEQFPREFPFRTVINQDQTSCDVIVMSLHARITLPYFIIGSKNLLHNIRIRSAYVGCRHIDANKLAKFEQGFMKTP